MAPALGSVLRSPVGDVLWNRPPSVGRWRSCRPDELYVIVSLYWAELTETAIAREQTGQRRSRSHTRDWVHRRRLTAEANLRRRLTVTLAVEAA